MENGIKIVVVLLLAYKMKILINLHKNNDDQRMTKRTITAQIYLGRY